MAGCTVLLPSSVKAAAFQKVDSVTGCTALVPVGLKQDRSGCTSYLNERILHQIKNNAGCIVLVPSFLKDELVRLAVKEVANNNTSMPPAHREAAIIPINKIPLRQNPPSHESARTVRYPRFLIRHKFPRLAAPAIN